MALSQLTFEERKWILKCYWKTENVIEVQRHWRNGFGIWCCWWWWWTFLTFVTLNAKHLSQDSRSPSRDLNPGPPKCEADVVLTGPQLAVITELFNYLFTIEIISCFPWFSLRWLIGSCILRQSLHWCWEFAVLSNSWAVVDVSTDTGIPSGWSGYVFFSFSLCPYRHWDPFNALRFEYRVSIFGLMRLGRDTEHSPPYNTEAENAWIDTSTPHTPSWRMIG
jgi:hypothetical protein